MRSLSVSWLPRGAKVLVRCGGRGCPPAGTRTLHAAGALRLTSIFARRTLRPGVPLELTLSAPGRRTLVVRWTMRDRLTPKRVIV